MTGKIVINEAKFGIGDKIYHALYGYRGIVLDVDSQYQNSDDWYNKASNIRPAKNQPWYQILVHGTDHITYVAEQNLQLDCSGEDIEHPVIPLFFARDENGHYQRLLNLQ